MKRDYSTFVLLPQKTSLKYIGFPADNLNFLTRGMRVVKKLLASYFFTADFIKRIAVNLTLVKLRMFSKYHTIYKYC